jgi:hypothetical protein
MVRRAARTPLTECTPRSVGFANETVFDPVGYANDIA